MVAQENKPRKKAVPVMARFQNPGDRKLVAKAADKMGMSDSLFIVQAAVERAKQLLRKE